MLFLAMKQELIYLTLTAGKNGALTLRTEGTAPEKLCLDATNF